MSDRWMQEANRFFVRMGVWNGQNVNDMATALRSAYELGLEEASAAVGFDAAHINLEYMESGDDWDKNMRDLLLRLEDRIRSLKQAGAK